MDDVIARARRMIQEAEIVVSFTGAGLSAESGLDTFRDPDGIWNRVDPSTVATPEAFERDPEFVIDWYSDRRASMGAAEPNAAHRALAGRNMTHITQNIDGLLEAAGASDVIHLHGTMWADRCHRDCGYRVEVDGSTRGLRACPQCGAWLRPDVVLFGELLPERAWRRAAAASLAADVLLVVGTSAEIYPAAGLIDTAQQTGARIIVVNIAPSAASYRADIDIRGRAGEILPLLLGDPEAV